MVRKGIIGLLVLMFAGTALAGNATMLGYCPKVACTGDSFVVYADYEYNGTDILGATVAAGAFPLSYNLTSDRYDGYFSSAGETVWNYTIWANSTNVTYGNYSINCSTRVTVCYNLTVNLYQEQELRTVANTSYVIVTERNYDKQLNRPYINDFAWILAQNQDQNGTAAYRWCNIPFGAGQSLTDAFGLGNIFGVQPATNVSGTIFGRWIGCENFWFRAAYINGQAVIKLPYAGNYSLYLIDGVINWENDVAPPRITKSNLYLPLGPITIPDKDNYTLPIWISHAELDWWGSILSSAYPLLIVIGFFLFILLMYIGLPIRASLAILIIWLIIWTLIRLF